MPTSVTPPLPQNTGPVAAKTQRVNIQNADKNELEHVQRNLGDRIDELLKLINKTFANPTPTKTTGTSAVQAGSSQTAQQQVPAYTGHMPQSCAIQAFWPAATINGSVTAFGQQYYPAGATPAATLMTARIRPPYSGSVSAVTMAIYAAAPTAGTFTLKLYNQTQGNRTQTLLSNVAFGSAGQNISFSPGTFAFNAWDNLFVQLVTSGWTQNTAGGLEVKLFLQS